MKYLCFITPLLVYLNGFGQINLINTSTTSDLNPPSVIGSNIMINGYENYLVKSYDECDNLSPIFAPGLAGYWNILSRPDSNVAFILSSNLQTYNSKIYKSVDGGYNWVLKLDTSNYYVDIPAFFDANEGIAVGSSGKLSRTKDGGNTWLTGTHPCSVPVMLVAYGDSMICIGGITYNAKGGFSISKDRGNTWPVGGTFAYKYTPTDFYFLNKDTIIGASNTYELGDPNFVRSFNGGKNWVYSNVPLLYPYSIYVKNKNEMYVAGSDVSHTGIILKSLDLGISWFAFNTQIKADLTDINFLNDSIALVSGSKGTLFKWNSKTAVFTSMGTGLKENSLNYLALKIFPNPVIHKLSFQCNAVLPGDLKLSISNTLGQTVYSKPDVDLKEELDVSFLRSGIYYLKLENANGQRVFKVVKE